MSVNDIIVAISIIITVAGFIGLIVYFTMKRRKSLEQINDEFKAYHEEIEALISVFEEDQRKRIQAEKDRIDELDILNIKHLTTVS